MMVLRLNWRRNVTALLLLLEGTFIIAAIVPQGWLDALVCIGYAVFLVVVLYGDFASGVFDNEELKATVEALNSANADLTKMIEDHIFGSDT